MVDEGKERLNPSRDNNEGKHRRRKEAFLLCDPGWCVYILTETCSLTSRIKMTTQQTNKQTWLVIKV